MAKVKISKLAHISVLIGLSGRAMDALERHGCVSVGDVVETAKGDLTQLPNVGPRTAAHIRNVLATYEIMAPKAVEDSPEVAHEKRERLDVVANRVADVEKKANKRMDGLLQIMRTFEGKVVRIGDRVNKLSGILATIETKAVHSQTAVDTVNWRVDYLYKTGVGKPVELSEQEAKIALNKFISRHPNMFAPEDSMNDLRAGNHQLLREKRQLMAELEAAKEELNKANHALNTLHRKVRHALG